MFPARALMTIAVAVLPLAVGACSSGSGSGGGATNAAAASASGPVTLRIGDQGNAVKTLFGSGKLLQIATRLLTVYTLLRRS